MTPNEFIGHNAFRVAVSEQWPPLGKNEFAKWMQHSDGTVLLYIRGIYVGPGLHGENIFDNEVREAFGTLNVCHACVGAFSTGRIVRSSDRVSWSNTKRLQYTEAFGTTERRGRRSRWGELCEPCRYHFAKVAGDKFAEELKVLGFKPPVISLLEELDK